MENSLRRHRKRRETHWTNQWGQITLVFILTTLLIISCKPHDNIEGEKEIIRSLMELVKEAHFKKDATLFYQPNADIWYDIRDGRVTEVSKDEQITGTQSYLDNMEFHELSPLIDPIIEISDDGTVGSYIGSVLVKGILNESPVFWVVSWQSVLRKIDDEWKIISTSNTEGGPEIIADVLLNLAKKKLGPFKENYFLSSMADCRGPQRSFKTNILSGVDDGRMEQVYGNSHLILKHGIDTSWTYDLKSGSLYTDMDNATKIFIKGHELHWLSFRPEDRYFQPELKEISLFREVLAFHIEFKDDLGHTVIFYYDFDDYRPLGFQLQPGNSTDPITVHFENWEEINDFSIFKSAFFMQGKEVFEYSFTKVQIDSTGSFDFENKVAAIQ